MAHALKPISAAQLGEKGQITIPKKYRKTYRLGKNSPVFMFQLGDILMLILPDKLLTEVCDKIRSILDAKGITVEKAKGNLQRIRKQRFQKRFGDLE